MDIDMKAMKAEIGGAFLVAWVMVNYGALEGALALAVAWLAFSGAHILPVVTWCNIMTGDLADGEGNWAANGMRLVAQVVGALLALVLATEAGGIETGWAPTDMWIPDIGDNIWGVLATIAAGAVWWQIHTRADSAWVSSFGLMTIGGFMVLNGASEMGASILGAGDGIVDTLVNWVCDGLFVGVGALVGAKIDDAV